MRRSWIPASLSCVPDVHSVSGYPVFSTGAVSAFSFRISFPAFLQILEYDHICMVSLLHILRSHLQFFFPASMFRRFVYAHLPLCLRRAMFPLESADPSQCAVHPVFFTGMIDEFSPQDSSVCPHDGTDRIGIDPQIHTADDLFFYRCLRKCHFFRIRKNAGNICGASFSSVGADAFFPDQFLRRYSISV